MPTGAWLADGFPEPDEYDTEPAEALTLGRFACELCADNRDAAERAAVELRRRGRDLARAYELIRAILVYLRPRGGVQ